MATSTTGDASGKKVRKPYTITKSRESWTEEEHNKFLEALQLWKKIDCDWKKIEDFVGSKIVIQIRSHAQKYFLKVQKNGTIAHVPPPSPKQKASHPYPQKASKMEEDKARLVQETGLQLKQINNWFINQRKRNWHSNTSTSTVLKSKRKR